MKIRKELWFGFILMALIIAGTAVMLVSAPRIESGHLGLMMLALVVVAIMLGFPTAFTLMGMGMIFTWLAYNRDTGKSLTLMEAAGVQFLQGFRAIAVRQIVIQGETSYGPAASLVHSVSRSPATSVTKSPETRRNSHASRA